MRASSGVRAGKQAEGTPSQTDLPAAGRRTERSDICRGHSAIADEGSDWSLRRATLAGHPNTTTTSTPPDYL